MEIDGRTSTLSPIPIVHKWHIFIFHSHSVTDVVRHIADEREKSVRALWQGADINKNRCIEAAPTFFIHNAHRKFFALRCCWSLSHHTEKWCMIGKEWKALSLSLSTASLACQPHRRTQSQRAAAVGFLLSHPCESEYRAAAEAAHKRRDDSVMIFWWAHTSLYGCGYCALHTRPFRIH